MSHTLEPIVDNSYAALSNEEVGETHQMRTITNNSSRKNQLQPRKGLNTANIRLPTIKPTLRFA